MHDLISPLLSRDVVSGLVGLSAATLRRWDVRGIVSLAPSRRLPRRYSWREVEQLQHAVYLAQTKHLSLVEVRDLLQRTAPQARHTREIGGGWSSPGRPSRARHPRRDGVTGATRSRSARQRGRGGPR